MERAPWVAVQFSDPVWVTGVELSNAKSNWERVGQVEVRVADNIPTDGSTVFSGGELFGVFIPGDNDRLEGRPRKGRFVIIQRDGGEDQKGVLIMEEIRVFGYDGEN